MLRKARSVWRFEKNLYTEDIYYDITSGDTEFVSTYFDGKNIVEFMDDSVGIVDYVIVTYGVDLEEYIRKNDLEALFEDSKIHPMSDVFIINCGDEAKYNRMKEVEYSVNVRDDISTYKYYINDYILLQNDKVEHKTINSSIGD